ncbi:aldo/keto reductase [Corallococcus terminator]|uniref:Aldo/keto reductase n=1 Tax=Corallococcus terminator TaxID=2316733 RepID=A0A3A8IMC6_9BACT|nr:aldo/keto reductase [Corallococcus terminator]RKG84385.1 aldo/keto reductase [Corallococcus terminator]
MRYRLFGNHTGLRVSELVLGAGAFGTRWGHGADPQESRRIFDGYVEAGGNFIDTADGYQFGESETLLGGFLAPNRDDFVLATKYTRGAAPGGGLSATGNSRKVMVRSLEESLQRLKTDHVDLYWVHMPDGMTPMEEILRGLDDLVRAGKVLYIGLSDFQAWRVSYGVALAQLRGWAPIAGVQLEYSLVERTPERELLPMAQAFGLGTVGWSPLGGGLLTGKYRRGEQGRREGLKTLVHAEDTDQKRAIVDTLEAVAKELDTNTGRVAIAWVSARGVMPILGPRTRAQLDDNLAAASLVLSPEQLQRLDAVSAVPLGFPHELLAAPDNVSALAGGKGALLALPSTPVA